MRFRIDITDELVEDVAVVLQRYYPRAPLQSLAEHARLVLEESNKLLAERDVPAQPAGVQVSPLAFDPDPLRLEDAQVGAQLPQVGSFD